jgi:predicted anti-sigma-YlaC factor YlaD
MNKRQLNYTAEKLCVTCTNPVIQEQVFAYIADQIEDSAAEEVEDHLLECRHCREFFLIMLSIRGEAQKVSRPHGSQDCLTSNDALVPRLADFRKKWS